MLVVLDSGVTLALHRGHENLGVIMQKMDALFLPTSACHKVLVRYFRVLGALKKDNERNGPNSTTTKLTHRTRLLPDFNMDKIAWLTCSDVQGCPRVL
jgi:hypothetical protein